MSTNTAAMYALLEQARRKNAANKLYRLDMFDPVSAPASTSVPAGISTEHGDGTGVRSVRDTSVAPEGFASSVAANMGKSLTTGALGSLAMGGTGIPSVPGVAKSLASSITGASDLAGSITGKKALGVPTQAALAALNTGLSLAIPGYAPVSFLGSIVTNLAARAAFGDDLDNGLARGFGYSDFGGVQSRMDTISNNVFGSVGDPLSSGMYGNQKSYMDSLADGLFGDPSSRFGDRTTKGLDGPPGGHGDYDSNNAPGDIDDDVPDGFGEYSGFGGGDGGSDGDGDGGGGDGGSDGGGDGGSGGGGGDGGGGEG